MTGPDGPAGRKVMLHLLRDRPDAVSARKVAAAVDVSFQSVNEVLRFLEFHGALTPRPRTEIRWRRLAEITASLRLAAIDPKRTLHLPGDAGSIGDWFKQNGIPYRLAFTTAANLWAFFEEDPVVHVVVDHKTRRKMPTAPGDIRSATRTVRLFFDDLSLLDTTTIQGLPVTTQLQTWLDLRHFPQAGAHAAFFRQVLAQEYPEALEP